MNRGVTRLGERSSVRTKTMLGRGLALGATATAVDTAAQACDHNQGTEERNVQLPPPEPFHGDLRSTESGPPCSLATKQYCPKRSLRRAKTCYWAGAPSGKVTNSYYQIYGA